MDNLVNYLSSDTLPIIIIVVLAILLGLGVVAYFILTRFILFKTGAGITKTYEADSNCAEYIIKWLLDDYNIPYRHARVIKVTHSTTYGEKKSIYTYY